MHYINKLFICTVNYDLSIFIGGMFLYIFSWWICTNEVDQKIIHKIRYVKFFFLIIFLTFIISAICISLYIINTSDHVFNIDINLFYYKIILILSLSSLPYLMFMQAKRNTNDKLVFTKKIVFYFFFFILLFFLSSGVFYYVI